VGAELLLLLFAKPRRAPLLESVDPGPVRLSSLVCGQTGGRDPALADQLLDVAHVDRVQMLPGFRGVKRIV
jgi:hypothetical protein